jgi:hypothetical protein
MNYHFQNPKKKKTIARHVKEQKNAAELHQLLHKTTATSAHLLQPRLYHLGGCQNVIIHAIGTFE